METFHWIQRATDENTTGVSTAHDYSNSSYKVFLRIKPRDTTFIDDTICQDCFSVEGNSLITTVNSQKNDKISTRYDFMKVLKPATTQEKLFKKVVFPALCDYFDGDDTLVFSYGTSNSGKSFTIQGTPNDPGVIPRLLHSLFSSVESNLDAEYTMKPDVSNAALCLSKKEAHSILLDKCNFLESLFDSVPQSPDSSISQMNSSEMNDVLKNVPSVLCPLPENMNCSIWVSFFEIYNEQIYDLFDCNQRKPLKLVQNKQESSYSPVGLKLFPAATWKEAYDLYRFGKRSLHISSTLLNRKSSRSHCVFSLKLLTRPKDESNTFYFVRNFAICDLAGTERMLHLKDEKTTAAEMQHINKSLLTLNKCLMNLKCQQNKVAVNVPPFRDSKLTMIFKKFLLGGGKLLMISNISQDPELFAQTQVILKMTAMALEIRVQAPPVQQQLPSSRRRYSTMYAIAPPVRNNSASTSDGNSKKELDELKLEIKRLQEEQQRLIDENCALEAEKMRLNTQFMLEMDRRREVEESTSETHERLHVMLAHEKARATRYRSYTIKLEEQLSQCRRKAHEDRLNWHSRLTTQQSKYETLLSKLAEAFNIDTSEPVAIVDKVLFIHKDMMEAVSEELDEYSRDVKVLKGKIASLEKEKSLLKGRLWEVEEQQTLESKLTVPDLKGRLNEQVPFESSDSDDTPPRYRNVVSLSEGEVSPPCIPQKLVRTAIKSKKKTKKMPRKLVEIPSTVYPSAFGDEEEKKPKQKARRKLLSGSEDYLGTETACLDTEPETLSPGMILKRALRPRKL